MRFDRELCRLIANAGLSLGETTELVPLRDHGSRDVRATVVRALGSLCSSVALGPLEAHYPAERSLQVKYAITAAVQALGQCGN